ncbi:MAG: hypothetical protein KatS3mg087_1385 [Patescibacteria group bacterium]|nr:MAG: hypothetical protein KatS3mg087_1385 [Patescibacteria group bacterium]
MYNVAKQIARTPIKNVTFPRRCTSSEGSVWTPAQANPQLWSLDNTKHRSGLVTGWDGVSRKVLESNEAYGTYRAPEPGRCYQFDGTDDYIDTPLLSELNNDLTFAMKVKFTTLGTMQLFDGGIPSGNGRRYLGLNSSSKLRFGTHGQTVDGVTTLVSGQWYWCVVTLANLDVTIYLDGVVEKLVTLSSKDNLANNTLKIGRYAGSLSLLLNAKVSFAGVWDRALSAQEVADLPTTVPATPMASYRCNEGDGTTAYDSSGNSNHGTVINATLSTFHATDAGITDNDANIRGYSLQGNARVPAINDTTDALGNSLTYTGQCPHPVGVETPGITNHDGTVYLSAPHLTGSETVTSYEGTGVPTVSAGRIDWPSGTTINQIVLSTVRITLHKRGQGQATPTGPCTTCLVEAIMPR